MTLMSINPEITSLIDHIERDKTHGASELARQAAGVLKAAAERSHAGSTEDFVLEQREVGERLMSARPAMAPLFNIVSRLLGSLPEEAGGMALDSLRRFAITRADEAVKDSLEAVARIARFGSELVSGGDKILTHSYSSTVAAVIKAAVARHGDIEVIVTRSGPGRTGERIALELGSCRVPLTFIDDTAVGLYLGAVSKVMVGADRVCADGMVVNGIGSYQLAVVAARAGVPFYVLCETLKFDPRVASDEVDLEEKEASEMVAPGVLPPQVRAKNPYFDITPPELVTAVVTEKGLLTPAEVISCMGNSSL